MAQRIIVTGGCGFIGREVVAQLVARGDEVVVVDDQSKTDTAAPKGAKLVRRDLADGASGRDVFASSRRCIHLAAKVGGIGYFHRRPATILRDNQRIDSTVFDACAHHKYERIVYFSSSMVFEQARHFPSKESDLASTPAPASAYGFSKLSGEWCCRAFWEQEALPFSIVRPFNAYGASEAPGTEIGEAHVIPDLAKKLVSGQDPLEILGDGRQTRCFTHVSDIARGALLALDSPNAHNEDFNIASAEETTMMDLAKTMWELVRGDRVPFRVRHVGGFPHDVPRRVADVTKAKAELGFEARASLRDELPAIIEAVRRR